MSYFKLSTAIVVLLMLLIFSCFGVPDWINPWNTQGIAEDLFWNYRLPKTLTALFAGASLSVSGFILQQLYRNQLAGPYILGVSSGASLAVAILIIGSHYWPWMHQSFGISVAGFIGASVILILLMLVSKHFGTGAIILLFGVIGFVLLCFIPFLLPPLPFRSLSCAFSAAVPKNKCDGFTHAGFLQR